MCVDMKGGNASYASITHVNMIDDHTTDHRKPWPVMDGHDIGLVCVNEEESIMVPQAGSFRQNCG